MTVVSTAATAPKPARHTVLAETDSGAYHSLRQRPVTRAERYALGKSLRKRVPRRSLADWTPPADRPDPVDLIEANHRGRLDRLIPVRVGRMVASPYGFLRGTAVVMAEDVAHLPSTGITPVVCGDSHLGNFGFYASPERDLVIDLNDFDEAHPGGWEWDLRRLVASIWVAGPAERRLRGRLRARRCAPASAPTASRCAAWPTSRCSRAPSPASTSTGWPARRPDRWPTRCSGRPNGRGTAPATARCPGSPGRSTASAGSSRSRR